MESLRLIINAGIVLILLLYYNNVSVIAVALNLGSEQYELWLGVLPGSR